MLAILDTNPLVGDWRLRGVSVQALLTAARTKQITVAIPEVVVLELINKHRERLTAAHADRDAAQRKLQDLLIEDNDEPDDNRQLTDANQRYAEQLRKQLEEARVRVLPVPDLPHATLIERALQRRKPFNAKTGAGYRDALIWESVLRAAEQLGDATFITEDADFISAEDHNTLHETLRDEAAGRGVAIQLERRLHRYVQTNIESVQAALDLLRQRAANDTKFIETVHARVKTAVADGYAEREDVNVDIPRLESVHVDEVVTIESLVFDYVYPVGTNRVSFELEALCGIELTIEGYEPSQSERQDWDPVGWIEYGTAMLTFEGVAEKASADVVELRWSGLSYG